MTVKQTSFVDYLGVEKGSDVIVLTIVDDLDWRDEQKHLVLLQDKVNTYLRFVESGEVFESLEETLGAHVQQNPRIRVSLLLKH